MGGRLHGQCPDPYLVPAAPKKPTLKTTVENRTASRAVRRRIKRDGDFGSARLRLFILGTA